MSEGAETGVKNANDTEKDEGQSQSVPVGGSDANLARRIQDQIEFYLGDVNLPRDTFFQQEIKKDDGWIPITTFLKCNRLSELTKDPDVIANAVAESSLIQVSDDRTKIRRNPEVPLPENSLEYWQGLKKQSVYIKGFPKDATLGNILDFMKKHGNIINVLMRREKTGGRAFKGSVFATFKTIEEAEAFVKSDVNKYNDMDLIKMMQNDYWTTKQREIKERKAADREAKLAKKRKDMDEQKKAVVTAVYAKGLVLSLENLPKENVSYQKLKDFFNKYGRVAYCVYEEGDDKAQLRFSGEENEAAEAWKKAVADGEDGKVLLDGKEIIGKVLEGEEEEAYWDDFSKNKADRMNRGSNRNKRRRGGRYGGYRNENGREKKEDNGEPPAKKSNVEAETDNSKIEAEGS